jgi:hypothetical protein
VSEHFHTDGLIRDAARQDGITAKHEPLRYVDDTVAETEVAVRWPEDVVRETVFVPGNVVTQHQCPPDRVAMAQNLVEIQASYNERLANQRQVIENLSTARHALLAANARYETFVRDVACLPTPLGQQARELLTRQEEG